MSYLSLFSKGLFTVVKSKRMIPKIEDHKIFESKITRSQKKTIQKTRITKIRRSRSCDHKARRDQNHMIMTKWIMDQIIFRSQTIRSNYFPIPYHKIKMFSYLRSQDQIIFIFQITSSIFFFGFQITRSNYFSMANHKIT